MQSKASFQEPQCKHLKVCYTIMITWEVFFDGNNKLCDKDIFVVKYLLSAKAWLFQKLTNRFLFCYCTDVSNVHVVCRINPFFQDCMCSLFCIRKKLRFLIWFKMKNSCKYSLSVLESQNWIWHILKPEFKCMILWSIFSNMWIYDSNYHYQHQNHIKTALKNPYIKKTPAPQIEIWN